MTPLSCPPVSDAEAGVVLVAERWQDMDRNLRDRLYQRFGRMVKHLPAAVAAELAAAKSDRQGKRQLSFIKLYLRDPTFGSLRMGERQEVHEASESTTMWSWESIDDLGVRYHFLPKDERDKKIAEEVASATKKTKHPTKKGAFIYRFWRGIRDEDKSGSSKRRHMDLEVFAFL